MFISGPYKSHQYGKVIRNAYNTRPSFRLPQPCDKFWRTPKSRRCMYPDRRRSSRKPKKQPLTPRAVNGTYLIAVQRPAVEGRVSSAEDSILRKWHMERLEAGKGHIMVRSCGAPLQPSVISDSPLVYFRLNVYSRHWGYSLPQELKWTVK